MGLHANIARALTPKRQHSHRHIHQSRNQDFVASSDTQLNKVKQSAMDITHLSILVCMVFSRIQCLVRAGTHVVAWTDQFAQLLFDRPRWTQWSAGLICLLFLGWSFWSMRAATPALPSVVDASATSISAPTRKSSFAEQASTDRATPLHIIFAYNAASIAAGQMGDSTLLHPFLTATGPARDAADAEFDRRSRRLERHDPELVRWGLLTSDIGATTARIETQEVWHDTTLIGGRVISADRNMITRHTYHLVRQDTAQPWLIEHIETASVVR
jgi:hypothetical protein